MQVQNPNFKQFATEQVGEVLQKLLASEIDVSLKSVAGIRFDWSIGDSLVPEKVKSASPTNNDIAKTVSWIAKLAVQYYPESDFAEWYKLQLSQPTGAGE